MHELVVTEGTLSAVSAQVRMAVEEVGGVVSEQALVRTRFDNLRPAGETFSRCGYVGVYQPFGSKAIEVRVRLWAQWPRRIISLVLVTGFLLALALAGVGPDPTTWIWAALFSWGGLALGFLFYASTWDVSRGLEARLAKAIADHVEEATGQDVWTPREWDERVERLEDAAHRKVRDIRGKARNEHVAAHAATDSAAEEPPATRRFGGRRAKAASDAEPGEGDKAAAEPEAAPKRRWGKRAAKDADDTPAGDGEAAEASTPTERRFGRRGAVETAEPVNEPAKDDASEGAEPAPKRGLRSRLGRRRSKGSEEE